MTVKYIIDHLRSGELKNLFVGEDDKPDNLKDILLYINIASIELHKEFRLNTKTHRINVNNYDVDYDLPDDCMKIIMAYSSNGNKISINDENDFASIYTSSDNIINIPNNHGDEDVLLVYVASPAEVDDVNDETGLNVKYLEPLLHYIGYRAHSSQDGLINYENTTHYNRYMASVDRIKKNDMVEDETTQFSKFRDKGFI